MEIQDGPNGSGEGVLPRLDALWSELLRRAGDVLELDLTSAPNVAGVRNRYAECRQISAPGGSFSNGPQKSEDAVVAGLAENNVRFVELRSSVLYLAGLQKCSPAQALERLIESTGGLRSTMVSVAA
ncbi:hypothetical protein [Burkholderia territorii]|uniref:hypothetical protein n=1 Tax=Burkholderia territorii TaxID=1503055 RepID=UPI001E30E278|nr:hypothetical protein [Burkholderia territorii]